MECVIITEKYVCNFSIFALFNLFLLRVLLLLPLYFVVACDSLQLKHCRTLSVSTATAATAQTFIINLIWGS